MLEADSFQVDKVKRALDPSGFWTEVVYLPQIGSTNDLAKDLASRGATAGTVIVADEQTAGRGRLGRSWVAPPRANLLSSLLFRPNLQPEQAHRLTMLCSMAAADAIEELTSLRVALKWPNDLVVKSSISEVASSAWRKLAGVLTEAELNNVDLAFVVVGIGINVNVPKNALAELAPRATSILAETGRKVGREELLITLLEAVEARYARLLKGDDPRQAWAERLVTLGREVRVTTSQGTLRGTAESVDENGALLLRGQDGSLQRLLAGDVTLVGP